MRQNTESLTNMPNSGSAHKYAKLQKRSQLCKISEALTFCQITEALTNVPSYGSDHKCPKIQRSSQITVCSTCRFCLRGCREGWPRPESQTLGQTWWPWPSSSYKSKQQVFRQYFSAIKNNYSIYD